MRSQRHWPLWLLAAVVLLAIGLAIGYRPMTLTPTRSQSAPLAALTETPLTLTSPEEQIAPISNAAATPSSAEPTRAAPSKPLATEGSKHNPARTASFSGVPMTPSAPLDTAAKEQLGRLALHYVGADPAADEVWAWLINEPDLPPKVREDLIEDLNENGFSGANGRKPTVDDLPLIERRISLLEEHAPFTMDEANAAAFAEAYKDLVNMWLRLSH